HGVDRAVAPVSSGSLGFDRFVRRLPPPAVACPGLRLETAALRFGSGSAPGREDATDPQIYQGVGATRPVPLRGRDRPLAIPTVARLLGAAWGRRRGPAVRGQRPARHLRSPQPAKRDASVRGAAEAAERRLANVPRAD